jgi:hypothetical protein
MSGNASKASIAEEIDRNHVNATANERDLDTLRADFPGWRIWRTRDGDVLVCWVATLHDPAAGVAKTVITETAKKLREQLGDQARQAARADLTRPDETKEILHGWGEVIT